MTVPLLQLPRPLAVDANGVPRAGAKLYVDAAGTSTPEVVYQDADLTVLHASPIIANTDGLFPPIYVDPALGAIKINLTTATDVQVPGYPIDNIPTQLPVSAIDFTATRTPTEIANGIVPADFQFDPGDVRRYGADPVSALDSSSAIAQAMAASQQVVFGSDGAATYRVSTNLTLTRGVTFVFPQGASLSVDAGQTISIGGQIDAGSYQIFAGAGNVLVQGDYTHGPGVYNIKWWGAQGDNVADDTLAFMAACNGVTSGLSQGTLDIPIGQYRILSSTSGGLGIVVGGSINIQGHGQHTILCGVGFSSSAAIMSRGSVSNPQLNFFMRDIRFLSDNSGAAAMSVSYCSDCEFTNIYLDTLANGIICGTNVFSNRWTIRHLGGVVGRNFMVTQGGFNNNIFIGGRLGGAGFVMQHPSGGCAGNIFYGIDLEGILAAGTGGCYIAPTGTGVVRGISFIGCYAENANSPLIYASGSAGAIYGLTINGCYLNGQNAGATYAITVQNVNGISIRGNDFDAWATGVINNLGGNSNWDVGPNDYTNTPVWSSDSATQVLSNGSTVQTSVATQNSQITVSSAAAVTGIIMAVGAYDGQTIAVSNVNGANSVTMAIAATSHVATGTGCVIAAGTQKIFTWRATGLGTPAWFST